MTIFGAAEILITLAPFLTPFLPPAAVFFLTEHDDPPAIERSIDEMQEKKVLGS